MKISENVEKITLPDTKKVVRFFNQDGTFNSDGILLNDEPKPDSIYHPFINHKSTDVSSFKTEELHHLVVENGKVKIDIPTVEESAEYAQERLSKLNEEHKRFDNPHVYKVGVSMKLRELKDQLVQKR